MRGTSTCDDVGFHDFVGIESLWKCFWLGVASLVFASAAMAECRGIRDIPFSNGCTQIYDKFDSDALDESRWSRKGSAVYFIHAGGHLHFPCVSAAGETLIATQLFPPGFFELEFKDYRSTNASAPGRGQGSYVALGLSVENERVRTIRGDVFLNPYFEGNHFHGGTYDLWYDSTNAASGRLGIFFDGRSVKFYYGAGLAPGSPWNRVGPVVTPAWTSSPRLYVGGSAGGSGCTEFSITEIKHTALPLSRELQKALE